MKLKYIQGTWDAKERKGPGVFIGDQTYIQLELDGKLKDLKGPDFRVPHTCSDGKPYDFWGHQYPDENLISFMHHNSDRLDICDYKTEKHSYHDNCGYAGGTFHYLIDGIEYNVTGGWSSGETHYNQVTGKDYTHCSALEPGQLGGWGGMSVPISFLVAEIARQNLPYKLIRGLGADLNVVEAVHIEDVDKFITQAGMWRPESYSRTGTRWASQYSDIEGPSKYRTRYIKDDIANAQILN